MTNKTLFALWGGMFILCAALGFIPEPTGILRGIMTCLAVLFFLPPAWLLYRSAGKDRRVSALIRNLSALSLGLTLTLILGNFLVLMAPEAVGNVLYGILVIVSSPMVCGQFWVLSLFLWACLLMASLSILGKQR